MVQDPEMLSYWPGATVVPRGLDLTQWPEVGIEKKDRPLVVHAPSDPFLKGSHYVDRAVKELQKEGLKFEYKPITGMPHDEAVEWYRRADVIIDQILIGWYGVLAMEGMALGKPVVAYLRQDLVPSLDPVPPVENANPDNIKDGLRRLVTDYEYRAELAAGGRKYVDQVHDIKKVTRQLTDEYRKLLSTEQPHTSPAIDLSYFSCQLAQAVEPFQGETGEIFFLFRLLQRRMNTSRPLPLSMRLCVFFIRSISFFCSNGNRLVKIRRVFTRICKRIIYMRLRRYYRKLLWYVKKGWRVIRGEDTIRKWKSSGAGRSIEANDTVQPSPTDGTPTTEHKEQP